MNASAKPTVRRSAVEICASTINTAITNPSLTGVRGIRSHSLNAASAIAIPVVWGIARMADGPLKVTKPVLVNKLQPHMQFRRPTSTYELIAVTVKKMHKCSFSDLSLLISLWLLHYIGTHWDCIPKGNDTSFQACPFSTRRPN